MLDLASGLAFDTALVMELSNLYGLQMRGHAARRLLKRLSLSNAVLGGVQLAIQLTLGLLKQFLIFLTPITGGLSLASATPVALAQAAIAVHSTRMTGRLAAKMFLSGSQRMGAQPGAMLRRLATKDSQVNLWLANWRRDVTTPISDPKAFLP